MDDKMSYHDSLHVPDNSLHVPDNSLHLCETCKNNINRSLLGPGVCINICADCSLSGIAYHMDQKRRIKKMDDKMSYAERLQLIDIMYRCNMSLEMIVGVQFALDSGSTLGEALLNCCGLFDGKIDNKDNSCGTTEKKENG